MSHVLATILLLKQLMKAQNARGISIKTQELYFLVFITRYLDLFTTFYSVYNSTMKIFYITITAYTIYMVKYQEPYKSMYNRDQDPIQHFKFAVAPCITVAVFAHLIGSGFSDFNLMEFLWHFSIYLESIAIFPQLVTLRRYRLVENLTGKFMFFLGSYRFLYIINWIYRAHTEPHYRHHYVVYFCGVLQTVLYADFFYQYYKVWCCHSKRDDDDDDSDDGTRLLFEQELSSKDIHSVSADPLLQPTTASDGIDETARTSSPSAAQKRKLAQNDDKNQDILMV